MVATCLPLVQYKLPTSHGQQVHSDARTLYENAKLDTEAAICSFKGG